MATTYKPGDTIKSEHMYSSHSIAVKIKCLNCDAIDEFDTYGVYVNKIGDGYVCSDEVDLAICSECSGTEHFEVISQTITEEVESN